jgi:hypothetical protein
MWAELGSPPLKLELQSIHFDTALLNTLEFYGAYASKEKQGLLQVAPGVQKYKLPSEVTFPIFTGGMPDSTTSRWVSIDPVARSFGLPVSYETGMEGQLWFLNLRMAYQETTANILGTAVDIKFNLEGEGIDRSWYAYVTPTPSEPYQINYIWFELIDDLERIPRNHMPWVRKRLMGHLKVMLGNIRSRRPRIEGESFTMELNGSDLLAQGEALLAETGMDGPMNPIYMFSPSLPPMWG